MSGVVLGLPCPVTLAMRPFVGTPVGDGKSAFRLPPLRIPALVAGGSHGLYDTPRWRLLQLAAPAASH